MRRRFPDLDVVFIESGGDNPAATFSPDLADITLYVIDVAAGEKIPRKEQGSAAARLRCHPGSERREAGRKIERCARSGSFVQVLVMGDMPLGQRRYWPIYEAAQDAGLPIGVHAFGFGGNPITASGWPSYYIEEMVGH